MPVKLRIRRNPWSTYSARIVAIDMSGVPDLESTNLKTRMDAERRHHEQSMQQRLVEMNPHVLAMIRKSQLGEDLGREDMQFNLEMAVTKYQAMKAGAISAKVDTTWSGTNLHALANALKRSPLQLRYLLEALGLYRKTNCPPARANCPRTSLSADSRRANRPLKQATRSHSSGATLLRNWASLGSCIFETSGMP
jgi:hypothetical protein